MPAGAERLAMGRVTPGGTVEVEMADMAKEAGLVHLAPAADTGTQVGPPGSAGMDMGISSSQPCSAPILKL